MLHKIIILFALTSMATCFSSNTGSDAEEQKRSDVMTVYLVRHAEKAGGSNPVLTAAGEARAQRLAQMLADKDIAAIYSTDFRRTQMTAQPVADGHNLKIFSYDPSDLRAFARKITRKHRGETILVVGHSNTTPALTGILDGTEAHAPFEESDYSNIMMVSLPRQGKASMEAMAY